MDEQLKKYMESYSGRLVLTLAGSQLDVVSRGAVGHTVVPECQTLRVSAQQTDASTIPKVQDTPQAVHFAV